LRRLFVVNARNDLEALDEVHGLIKEVAQAWQSLPSLLSVKQTSAFAVN
jgi:flagellar protein FliS